MTGLGRWPSKRSGRLHVLDMWDGEVAQIVEWTYEIYIGQVVQRHGDMLLALGLPYVASFDKVFEIPPFRRGEGMYDAGARCFVNLLPHLQRQFYSRLPIYPLATPSLAIVARDPFRRLEFDDEVDE